MQVGDNYVYGEYSLVSSKTVLRLSLAVYLVNGLITLPRWKYTSSQFRALVLKLLTTL